MAADKAAVIAAAMDMATTAVTAAAITPGTPAANPGFQKAGRKSPYEECVFPGECGCAHRLLGDSCCLAGFDLGEGGLSPLPCGR